MTATLDDLKYPVGRFDWSAVPARLLRDPAIQVIHELPAKLRAAIRNLSETQLDTPYRPGGWTVRQVVHHLADSHANGVIRTKLGLTEEIPTIKPYDQAAWAELADTRMPIDLSLGILDGLHARWTTVWRSLTDAQFARAFKHPELGLMTLDQQLQGYAWHSRHHFAHITSLRQREGWGA